MKKPKTGAAKRTRFGRELEEAAKEILAHGRSEKKLPARRIVVPDDPSRGRRPE